MAFHPRFEVLSLSRPARRAARARRAECRSRHALAPVIEPMEARALLSTLTLSVLNTNDSGTGSLRDAINQANAYTDPDGSVITFDSSINNHPITLASTLILSEAPGPEVIQGPGANLVTISGNGANRVFRVNSGVTATISDLTVTGGSAPANDPNGGGIDNSGTLRVTDSSIEANSAFYGKGGGVENTGTLTLVNSNIANNGTFSDNGGGIENTETLTLVNSTIANNGTNGHYGGGVDNYGTLRTVNTTIAYNDGGG